MKRIGVDIDGMLCEEGPASERMFAEPNKEVVDLVNQAHWDGHTVIIFTARGWPDYRMTEAWLRKHGVQYSLLLMGKPNFDILLDDRATSSPTSLKDFLADNKPPENNDPNTPF